MLLGNLIVYLSVLSLIVYAGIVALRLRKDNSYQMSAIEYVGLFVGGFLAVIAALIGFWSAAFLLIELANTVKIW